MSGTDNYAATTKGVSAMRISVVKPSVRYIFESTPPIKPSKPTSALVEKAKVDWLVADRGRGKLQTEEQFLNTLRSRALIVSCPKTAQRKMSRLPTGEYCSKYTILRKEGRFNETKGKGEEAFNH